MKPKALFLALSLLSAGNAFAAAPQIVRAWGDWFPASDFERLGEFFGGKETHPGRCVLRSQETQREGWYLVLRLKETLDLTEKAAWRLELLLPNERSPRVHTYPITESSKVYQLGLTGNDWPEAKAKPVAWRVSLVNADGTVKAAYKSFLWE